MADTTINGLAIENTAPTANDLVGLWNVAAGRYEKIKRSNLLTGYGALAVANTWTAAQTMQAGINVGVAGALLARPMQGVIRQKLESVSIADNATLTISSDTAARGFFMLYNATDGLMSVGVANGSAVTLLFGGASFATTADNAGTINVYTSGNNIIVQNKRGGSRQIQVWLVL